MNAAEQINPVISRLETVLDHGNLPPPYDRWGARLLAHLTKPVQVVVTGFSGSGKSALIEMMSARSVFGKDLKSPIVELAYGDVEQAIVERADGSISSSAGLLKDCEIPGDAVRARQELPDQNLILQDYAEIGLDGSLAHKRAGLEMAIDRADLMIWCSQDFSEEEKQLWSLVPDHIKDHSVLALTMADRQLMRGVLSEIIERLEPIVAEEFLGLFPVATIQGITAQTGSETRNETLWASSGGKRLMELLSRQIKQGRTADVDQARIFMDRLATRMPALTQDEATPPKVAPPVEKKTEVSVKPAPQSALPDVALDANAVAVLSDAVDLLQKHATKVLNELDGTDELDADRILSGCSEAINNVADLLLTTGGDHPAAQSIQEDVQEGEEMLMLFQLERGEDAALDAVTLLLQIRKELADKLDG